MILEFSCLREVTAVITSPSTAQHPSADTEIGRAASAAPNRRVTPHRALPGTRAVVGGLLVAVAAVGGFVAQHRASQPARKHYLVARHDLATGQRLDPGDFVVRDADLPDPVARRAFTDPTAVRGSVLLAPVGAGELLQHGQVADAAQAPGRNQVSFSVGANRAVAGDLRAGDRIALVLASDTSKAPAVLATDLEVIRVARSDSAVDQAGRLTITVAARPDQVVGVARATNPDLLTVVRTTGVPATDRITVEPGG